MRQSPFPTWIRRTWPSGAAFRETKGLLEGLSLHTVCQSAHCPNQAECWQHRTATFMILGNICTRHCRFCAVNTGSPDTVEELEPGHVAEAVHRMGLRHAVITSVTRDDLADGGAAHFARTVRAVKELNPQTTVEVLTPDFQGDPGSVRTVLEAGPDVFGHNIETVAPLHPVIRDARYNYRLSLTVLKQAAEMAPDCFIKSGFMLGLGETDADIRNTLQDLRAAGCAVVTMGQYLQPTPEHVPVADFIPPDTFQKYEEYAYSLGFTLAVAGPFVRSSYRAETLFTNRNGERNEALTSCDTK